MSDKAPIQAPPVSALARVREAVGSGRGFADLNLADVSRRELKELGDALGQVRREVDVLLAGVAHQVSQRSQPAPGTTGMAREFGHRRAEELLSQQTGMSNNEARKITRMGKVLADADAPVPAPPPVGAEKVGDVPAPQPRLAVVAAAVREGRIGVPAADAIRAMVGRVHERVPEASWKRAERVLVAKAAELTYDVFLKAVRQHESWMKLDSLELEEHERREQRYLSLSEDAAGMWRINGLLDPETAAPLVAAVDGVVAQVLRKRKEDNALVPDTRTLPQVRADAMSMFARHMLGCDGDKVLGAQTKMIVTVTLNDLESRLGAGVVDGLSQPMSAVALRRMAADSEVIPVVLGGNSAPLDVGRKSRLFTDAQKAALMVRDGGCAMCGAPVAWCQAHHIEYWERDRGRTDLDNGVLLCGVCHHNVHDRGWSVRTTATEVWFRPPANVDPQRRERRGGRALFGYEPEPPPPDLAQLPEPAVPPEATAPTATPARPDTLVPTATPARPDTPASHDSLGPPRPATPRREPRRNCAHVAAASLATVP